MAKLTAENIKEKADAWAKLNRQIAKATETREAFLAPIVAKHDRKIANLQEQADKTEAEVIAWLNAQTKPIRIEAQKAIAELCISTVTKTGPRVIDVEAFIAKAKQQKKNPWPCVKVVVGQAEKLMGPKDIDSVSTKPETTSTVRSATLELK